MKDREERKRARAERQERREKKRKIAEITDKYFANTMPTYVNEDPLEVYDRNREPTKVLHDFFRQPMAKHRAGFLCCGGPSYRTLDVSKLNLPGVATVGLNNTARDLNCDVAVFSDPAEKFHHGIMLDHKVMKFVPLPRLRDRFRIKHEDKWLRTPARVNECPNVYGFKRDQDFDPEQFMTRDSACWGVDKKALRRGNKQEKMLNTFFIGLRIPYYLGIRRLYLVGVDFKMERGAEYAFAATSGNAGRALTNQNSYRIANSWCRMLKPIFDDMGYEIYNCNPNSGLDVFDYVPFDMAIQDAIGPCPQRPFSFTGWYDKVEIDETYWERNEQGQQEIVKDRQVKIEATKEKTRPRRS
jgi:hypothetical protein